MDSNSDTDEESLGAGSSIRVSEWELLTSDVDSNGHDGEVHEHDVDVHPEHFTAQEQQQEQLQQASSDSPGETPVDDEVPQNPEQQQPEPHVKDWMEPSTSSGGSNDNNYTSLVAAEEHEFGQSKQQDLELLSSLVTSVLESESGKNEAEDPESLALQREILAESGFSSLVPSDLHGNVLRPEEQEDGGGFVQEEGDNSGDDELTSWRMKLAKYCIKRASTLWSITIAAALMGLVIIGQRWHHERWQNRELRLQLCCKDEKISQLLFQIARLKEAVTGRRRIPVIKASSV